MMLLWLLACRHKGPEEPILIVPPPAPKPAEAPHAPSGTVAGGEYADGEYSFRLDVPEGWKVDVGTTGDAYRVGIEEPTTHARLEVRVWLDGEVGPRPRPDCDWNFEVEGHFRVVRVADPVVVATCTPKDPDDPRILGYYFERGGRVYGLEERIPAGALAPAKPTLDDAVGGLRFLMGF